MTSRAVLSGAALTAVFGAFAFDVLVPLDFTSRPLDDKIEAMKTLRDDYGLSRFVLISPWYNRYVGRGGPDAYRQTAKDLAWAVDAMKDRPDVEIGWWVAPSIGSALDLPGQRVCDCDGKEVEGGCPLDPEFVAAFRGIVKTGASLAKPRVIFFEDDYTLGNQFPMNDMKGCFCPHHLAAYAKRVGREYSAKEIADFFRNPTKENEPLREAFAFTIRDSLAGLAAEARKAIDEVDPTIRVCLCQSITTDWDGDSTVAIARAFAGPNTRPMVRVYGSAYDNENVLQDLPQRLAHCQWTLEHLPPDVEAIHETDAYPHTRFRNSSLFLMSELCAAVASGATGSYYYGTLYSDQPLTDRGYLDRLKEYLPRLEAARAARAGKTGCGVRLVYTPKEQYLARARAIRWAGNLPVAARFLGKMSLPMTTREDAPVALLIGNTCDYLSDDEIRDLLKGGLLLDGSAARALAARGFADEIGCTAEPAEEGMLYDHERILPEAGCRCPGKKVYNSHRDRPENRVKLTRKMPYMWLTPKPGAKSWSELVGLDGESVAPTTLFFENALGGRVGVIHQPITAKPPVSVANERKLEMYHRLVEKLAGAPLDVDTPNAPMTWILPSKSDTTLFFMAENLAGEPRDDIEFRFSPEWADGTLERLGADGKWTPCARRLTLDLLRPEFFRIVKPRIVSMTWGKSCNYIPRSTEPFDWSGSLQVKGAAVGWVDHLSYEAWRWSQHIEHPHRLFDAERDVAEETVNWKAFNRPGVAYSLEGLRFAVRGEEAEVTLAFPATKVTFTLKELREKGRLTFHAGGKYSGVPIEVYDGHDARQRLRKQDFKDGALVVAEDFKGAPRLVYHSMYGALVKSNETIRARFDLDPALLAEKGDGGCSVRVQLTGVFDYKFFNPDEPGEFEVDVNGVKRRVPFVFTLRASLPKLEDVYVEVPWKALKASGNILSVRHLSGKQEMLVHRVHVNAAKPTLKPRLAKLPPLGKEKRLHVGTETDLLTPANGDTDEFLDSMHEEQWGDFIKFRERSSLAPLADMTRWVNKVRDYDFLATLDANNVKDPEELRKRDELFGTLPRRNYLGRHGHEYSNLAYGWGRPDPDREGRTLPECRQSYLRRMKAFDVTGQAILAQHLDYEAGVKVVMSELPDAHASLMLAASRGAAKAYRRKLWGCHLSNHVTRAPLDQDHVRRLFMITSIAWLNGAGALYDEEVALRYNHDTIYAYSDAIPTAYRTIYQDLYHYGNAIDLGREQVKTCFALGNYDLVIGGLQAYQDCPRSKFWGKFGPETAGWDFDTPESGWKLIAAYLPGVWLYPVEQDPRAIRLFLSGTPKGQIDVTPITADSDILSSYALVVIPGWNTMTEELYAKLIEYVRGGGHLVLAAAQTSTKVTREFLVRKQGFDFLRNGDISGLCGVKIAEDPSLQPITAITFAGGAGPLKASPAIPALRTDLAGATSLATDQAGRPVLVENRIGRGRVWTLTAAEYWGHAGLAAFNRVLCDRLSALHNPGVSLEGVDAAEVDWHVYDCGGCRRLAFVNTDWTTGGNVKKVVVKGPKFDFPVEVKEGRMRHVLFTDDAALAFDVPGAIVTGFRASAGSAAFTLEGAGRVRLVLATSGGCRELVYELGPVWTKVEREETLR